ncbi:MAG: SDR family oxidoreductase [Christensenellaceae bacterium]|jgi:3-hydroxybutyrate dehydrogenase|nr:SDR family oxidoreductase [Christensenellaceae bacterium]
MKVLITGGTGSVGAELIKRFSTAGSYDVTFTYNSNQEKADSLALQFACKAVKIEDVDSDYDILVNNAGIVNSLVSCEDVALEKWEETLRVNLTLPFLLIKKNLPYMKARKWGRIINIASIYGVCAEEDVTPYSASKHGLIGLTRSVAKEYARYGITCNAICPGTIVSALSNKLADYYTSNEEERKTYFTELNSSIPAKRLVYPEEVANFVFFIASDKAAYINGATLMIDGGYTA